jgi:RND family efflux transporter MFP subunit
MKNFFRSLFPLLILVAAFGGFWMMISNKTEPPKVDVHKHTQSVRVATVKQETMPVELPSQGMVEAVRVTTLASEVAGQVVRVSDKFQTGQLFEEGDVMVELDAADYQAALTQAEATAADARLAEVTEKARAEQAVRDWMKLAGNEKPTDLAARKPHLESAAAKVKAAEAAVVKARRDLDRTKIKAPFKGRLRAKHTELGSYLAPGARVAELYSIGSYEVKLPLSLDDFSFLPEKWEGAEVMLQADVAGNKKVWKGRVRRVEGEVDRNSRSAQIVAEVSEAGVDDLVMKPGLFVSAGVKGRLLENVIPVSRKAFLDESRVLVVTPDNKVTFRNVKVLRGDAGRQFVSSGLKEGERVVVSALGAPVEGMDVEIVGEEKADNTGGDAP